MFFRGYRYEVLDEYRNVNNDVVSLVKRETGSFYPSYNIIITKSLDMDQRLMSGYSVYELLPWSEVETEVSKIFNETKMKRLEEIKNEQRNKNNG